MLFERLPDRIDPAAIDTTRHRCQPHQFRRLARRGQNRTGMRHTRRRDLRHVSCRRRLVRDGDFGIRSCAFRIIADGRCRTSKGEPTCPTGFLHLAHQRTHTQNEDQADQTKREHAAQD